MEINSVIHSTKSNVPILHSSLPLSFHPILFSTKLNFSLPNSLYLSHQNAHKWRPLAHDATAPLGVAINPANADSSLAIKKKATDVHADLKGTSIFLVGMNSAIKTSVGMLIADVLRYYYFDSDSVVEEAAGKDPSGKSFRERNEDGFRESETEVLKQLSSMGRLVVNAGNGAVQTVTNLALLRHGISIWIDVPLDMVAKGVVGDDDHKAFPDSFSEVLSQLTKLHEEFRDGYATADVTISLQRVASKFGYEELEQVTTEDMTLEILKEIEKLTRVKKMMAEAGKPF